MFNFNKHLYFVNSKKKFQKIVDLFRGVFENVWGGGPISRILEKKIWSA